MNTLYVNQESFTNELAKRIILGATLTLAGEELDPPEIYRNSKKKLSVYLRALFSLTRVERVEISEKGRQRLARRLRGKNPDDHNREKWLEYDLKP